MVRDSRSVGGIQSGRFRIFACCAALLIWICGCSKELAPGDRAEDERKVGLLEDQVAEAFDSRDLGKLVSLYAEDAALYDERAPIIKGKTAIRDTWKTVFAKPGLSMTARPGTVEISGDGQLAWAHGIFKIARTDAFGRPAIERWDYALIYKKQLDGSWKILADNVNSALRARLSGEPAKKKSTYAPLAPLIGLSLGFSTLWFMVGMPVVALVSAWKSWRRRRVSTGLLVSIVTFATFAGVALLLWQYMAAYYWNLPFPAAVRAAGDTARYGNPVEDTAEAVLVSLLTMSTLSAIAAGAVTGIARWMWSRRRR